MSLLTTTKKKHTSGELTFSRRPSSASSLIGQCEAILVELSRVLIEVRKGPPLCVILYFYTPSKPLISRLFNHDISPDLSLSRDSRALRCRRRRRCRHRRHDHHRRRRRCRRSLFFSFPLAMPNPHSPTLTNTTDLEKDFKKRVARSCRFTTYPRVRKAAGHIFPLHEKVTPHRPTSDIGH